MLAVLARGRAGRALLVGREALVPAHDAERAVRGGNDRAVVVVVEGEVAVVVLDRLTRMGLDEHERSARDLEVTPLRLPERVRREARHQLAVQAMDVEQPRVEA